MATCSLEVRDLIRNSIVASVAANPLTNGYEVGQEYPSEQARISALDAIGNQHGSTLYRVQPGGRTIVFDIQIPQITVDSYTQQNQQNKTPFQKANQNSRSEDSLNDIAEAFRTMIADDTARLNEYVESTLLSAKRISTRSKHDPELFDAMSEIWTAIKADPDGRAKVRMMAQYVSEARAVMSVKLDRMRELIAMKEGNEFPDHVVVEAMGIEEEVLLYKPLLDDFSRFMAGAPSNPVKNLVDVAYKDMNEVLSSVSNVHQASALKELETVFNPKYEKAKADMEAEITQLEENKRLFPARRISIDRKIAKIREDFERLAPSKQNLNKALTNQLGMSSLAGLNKFILAGIMNPDILVQGFMRIIKDKFQQAQNRFREVGNEIEDKFQQLMDTGFSTGNIDEAFRPIYTEVKTFKYNEETGEIEEFNELFFTSEQDQSWRTGLSETRAKMSKQGFAIQEYRQLATADPVVLAQMENEYNLIKDEYTQWRRNNFESEYGEAYHTTDRILDEVVTFQGEQISLRNIRSQFYDQINQIQDTVAALTGVPTQDEVDSINNLRREFEAIKSIEGKLPGSEEERIAQLFTQYQAEMKEMTERWDIPPSALDRFHLRKADIDRKFEAGEIDKEERDRWYSTNTTIVYSQDYWNQRKATVETLNTLSDELQRITGVVAETNLKDSYERMEGVSRKYRDHNSHIDGRQMTADERSTVLGIENAIEETKQATQAAYSGFLGEGFAQYMDQAKEERSNIAEEIDRLQRNDPTNSPFTKAKVAELKKRLKDMRGAEKVLASRFMAEKGVGEADIKAFHAIYDRYRAAIRALSELTESIETEAYYEERQTELNRFVAGKTEVERIAYLLHFLPPPSHRTQTYLSC